MQTLTVDEVLAAATTLSRAEQIQLSENLHRHLQRETRRIFCPGDSVKFKSRQGYDVIGIVQRVNEKSVKILSKMDRYGREGLGFITWSVSPSFLSPA